MRYSQANLSRVSRASEERFNDCQIIHSVRATLREANGALCQQKDPHFHAETDDNCVCSSLATELF